MYICITLFYDPHFEDFEVGLVSNTPVGRFGQTTPAQEKAGKDVI